MYHHCSCSYPTHIFGILRLVWSDSRQLGWVKALPPAYIKKNQNHDGYYLRNFYLLAPNAALRVLAQDMNFISPGRNFHQHRILFWFAQEIFFTSSEIFG